MMLVMNPGFCFYERVRAICLHDNLITVLGWMNADIPDWLAAIDPFNDVCASIRKEMGWN